MKFLRIIFYIVLFGIALASILPHLFPHFWLTDIFSHFKLQYVIILMFFLLPLALYFTTRKIIPIAFILILLIWNSWFIIPLYFQEDKIFENSGESFSILSMNLLASNTQYSEAMDLIRDKDPDVVVLLELSSEWEAQFRELYLQYPFRQMYTQQNNFGVGILSKTHMEFEVTDFGCGFPPSMLGKTKINGSPVAILATHPVPPVNQIKFEFRNRQFKEIAKLSQSKTGIFILTGDLNTSSYSRHFQELLDTGNLKDSRTGFGIISSWPSDILVMRTTLDHFLYKGKLQILTRTTERNIGSDHLPVYIRLSL